MSYDKKIREQAVKYREKHTLKKTSEVFGVSESAVRSWVRQYKLQGHIKPKELERNGRKVTQETLQSDVEKYPDAFNYERAKRFGCTAEAIRIGLKRYKITRKKNSKIQGSERY